MTSRLRPPIIPAAFFGNIVHVGDTFWNGIYPFIDFSIDGMIAASDANLAATTSDTIIIPGHRRPVSNRAELREFRDMLVAIRENVANLKKQGRSQDETVAAKLTAAFDAKWGQFVRGWSTKASDRNPDGSNIVPERIQQRQAALPRRRGFSDAAVKRNRDHFIWPSSLAAPLPVLDIASSA